MKAQRLKITEAGWENYTASLGNVEFVDGVSVEAVSEQDMTRLGSIIRMEAIDDDAQVGMGPVIKNTRTNRAPVVIPLAEQNPYEAPESVDAVATEKYTRASLEAIADEQGIGGLRTIAETYGVKGRGIVELINEILRVQG